MGGKNDCVHSAFFKNIATRFTHALASTFSKNFAHMFAKPAARTVARIFTKTFAYGIPELFVPGLLCKDFYNGSL